MTPHQFVPHTWLVGRPKSLRTPANSAFTYSYQSNADGDTLDAADLVRTINRY